MLKFGEQIYFPYQITQNYGRILKLHHKTMKLHIVKKRKSQIDSAFFH